jgi:hypothetical protein
MVTTITRRRQASAHDASEARRPESVATLADLAFQTLWQAGKILAVNKTFTAFDNFRKMPHASRSYVRLRPEPD